MTSLTRAELVWRLHDKERALDRANARIARLERENAILAVRRARQAEQQVEPTDNGWRP